VRFTGVNANDIDDNLSIRIASINGRKPEEAGISRIVPISAAQIAANRNYTIYNGAIRSNSNDRNLGNLNMGSGTLWGERVTAIADEAFENRGVTSVVIPSSIIIIGASAFANNCLTSVTIPEGVTTIRDKAFADNHWTTYDTYDNSGYTTHHGLKSVTIPNSVISIGQEAFASHWTIYRSSEYGGSTIQHWLPTEVTIGANVSIGKNAFGVGFEEFYASTGKQAGVYSREDTSYSSWEKFDSNETMEQTFAKRNAKRNKVLILGLVCLVGLVIGGGIYGALHPKPEDEKEK